MLSRVALSRRFIPCATRFIQNGSYPTRRICSDIGKSDERKIANDIERKKPAPKGMLARLLSPNGTGESPILRMLGYYSSESRAIGAGNTLYKSALSRSESATSAEIGSSATFGARFEMLAVHIYLILRRLRTEKDSPYEADVKTVMQCLFDIFWTDVRARMIMKDHRMNLIQSSKVIKDCEQRFFGMALAFDEAWDNSEELYKCVERNISCLQGDPTRIKRFRQYICSEKARLDKMSIEEVWGGECWNDDYPAIQSS